jgi:hypothetical protein
MYPGCKQRVLHRTKMGAARHQGISREDLCIAKHVESTPKHVIHAIVKVMIG